MPQTGALQSVNDKFTMKKRLLYKLNEDNKATIYYPQQ